MTRSLVFVALPLLLLGCAEGEDVSGDVEVIPTEPTPLPLPADQVPPLDEPAPCGVVLNVGAAWLDTVKEQAARWTAAAGCTITFGPEGIPVSLRSTVLNEGVEVPGSTIVSHIDGRFVRCKSIDVSHASSDPVRTLAHEIGHCLGVMGHTEGGLMKEFHLPGDSAAIDESALELLCSSVSCSKFVPEAPTFAAGPEEM